MCDDAQLPSAPWRPLSGSCYAKYWKYTHLLFRFLFHRRVVVAAATFTGTQPSALAFSGWWVVQGDGWRVVHNTGWYLCKVLYYYTTTTRFPYIFCGFSKIIEVTFLWAFQPMLHPVLFIIRK